MISRFRGFFFGVASSLGLVLAYQSYFSVKALPNSTELAVSQLIEERCIPYLKRGFFFPKNELVDGVPERTDGKAFWHLNTGATIEIAKVKGHQNCFIRNGGITWDLATKDAIFTNLNAIGPDWVDEDYEALFIDVAVSEGASWIIRPIDGNGRFIMWNEFITAQGARYSIIVGTANFDLEAA